MLKGRKEGKRVKAVRSREKKENRYSSFGRKKY